MATRVRFAIPEREIENNGITFRRDVNDVRHGTLTVRQNHLDWRPANHEYMYRITWDAFARFVEQNGARLRPKATAVRASKKLVRVQAVAAS